MIFKLPFVVFSTLESLITSLKRVLWFKPMLKSCLVICGCTKQVKVWLIVSMEMCLLGVLHWYCLRQRLDLLVRIITDIHKKNLSSRPGMAFAVVNVHSSGVAINKLSLMLSLECQTTEVMLCMFATEIIYLHRTLNT